MQVLFQYNLLLLKRIISGKHHSPKGLFHIAQQYFIKSVIFSSISLCIFYKMRKNKCDNLSHSTTRCAHRVILLTDRIYYYGIWYDAKFHNLIPEEIVCGLNIFVFLKQPFYKTARAFRLMPWSVCGAPTAVPYRFVGFQMYLWIMHLQITCAVFAQRSRWTPAIF